MHHRRSNVLNRKSKTLFPGGVNSPVRAFNAVGGKPVVIDRGEGPYLVDVDGNRYIDYMLSWGPLIVGHTHPDVVEAIYQAAAKGSSFGAPNAHEVELGELVKTIVPSMQTMRFVNSGTEATMSALRLARAYTGREKILKFNGCYHGHVDSLLVKGGSGLLTLGIPATPGVPKAVTRQTVTAPYNDLPALRKVFAKEGDKLAAVILEPVVGNSGCIPPAKDFLKTLRKLCSDHGVLLIFDEVMTGFRVAPGGAQERYKIAPDLTTLGKVIGGGLPVGAYGGKKKIMKLIAPEGDVYQAGTLSGNPLAMAAGAATLQLLRKNKAAYKSMEKNAATLVDGLKRLAAAAGIPATANQVGTMFTFFFNDKPVETPEDAMKSNADRYAKFHRAMLEKGVYFPPSQFEAAFISTEHDKTIIADTLAAAEEVFEGLRKGRGRKSK